MGEGGEILFFIFQVDKEDANGAMKPLKTSYLTLFISLLVFHICIWWTTTWQNQQNNNYINKCWSD